MKGPAFVFEHKQFKTLEEMVEKLLHEANEQIVKIDMGYVENDKKERNFIRWRLQHLEYHFKEKIPAVYKTTYNSLWSQLYRLEHQCDCRSAYLHHILGEWKAT